MASKVSIKILDINTQAVSRVEVTDTGLRFYFPDNTFQDLDLTDALRSAIMAGFATHEHKELVSGNTTARLNDLGNLEITDNIKINSSLPNKTYNPTFSFNKEILDRGESAILTITGGPENSIVSITSSNVIDTITLNVLGSGSKSFTFNQEGLFVFAGVFDSGYQYMSSNTLTDQIQVDIPYVTYTPVVEFEQDQIQAYGSAVLNIVGGPPNSSVTVQFPSELKTVVLNNQGAGSVSSKVIVEGSYVVTATFASNFSYTDTNVQFDILNVVARQLDWEFLVTGNHTLPVPEGTTFADIELVGAGGGASGGSDGGGIGTGPGGKGGHAGQRIFQTVSTVGITNILLKIGVGGYGGISNCWEGVAGSNGEASTATIGQTVLIANGGLGALDNAHNNDGVTCSTSPATPGEDSALAQGGYAGELNAPGGSGSKGSGGGGGGCVNGSCLPVNGGPGGHGYAKVVFR